MTQTTDPPAEALTWHCRRCHHPIGEYVRHRGVPAIKMGGGVVRCRVTIYCERCSHRWQWRPEDVEGEA